MICAFSPSSVNGCESLAIKHAVSGFCCVWVFGSSGLPRPLLRGSGIWWARPPSRAPAAPRLGRGRHRPQPRVPEWHLRPPRPAATPSLPGAPTRWGYCDIDTTASGHRDKEQEEMTRITLPLEPTATAAPQLEGAGDVKPMQASSQSQTEGSGTTSPSLSFAKSV